MRNHVIQFNDVYFVHGISSFLNEYKQNWDAVTTNKVSNFAGEPGQDRERATITALEPTCAMVLLEVQLFLRHQRNFI